MDNSDLSVQQLFETLSINEIQDLNRSYHEKAINARLDLQKLVSNKYRDLISITDDISQTFESTKLVSSKLSQLAYGSSHFISFNTSNTSKFYKLNSQRFADEIAVINNGTKLAIPNLVLHDKLEKFDIKLIKNGPIPHTSNYIYLAQCYYTLSKHFGSEIHENQLLNHKFKSMKSNLLRVLESGISEYNISCKSLYTSESDTFHKSQQFRAQNIISKVPIGLEEIEFNLEELVQDDSEETLNGEEIDFSFDFTPMINYLVAYILIESDSYTITKSQTLFKFLDFRFNHLSEILNQFAHVAKATKGRNVKNINIFQILKFIENTFGYIEQYFDNDSKVKNPLLKALASTDRWNTDILGYDNYKHQIKFNTDPLHIHLPESSQTDLQEYKHKFVNVVQEFFEKLIEIVDLSVVVPLFINYISSVKKIEVWSVDNGFKSLLTPMISSSDSLSKALNSVINIFQKQFPDYLNEIAQSGTIYTKIHNDLETKEIDGNLFDSKLVDLVNEDISQYFNLITNASSNASFSISHDIIKILSDWIKQGSQYLSMIDVTTDTDLAKLIEYLAKPIEEVSNKYGKFTKKLVVEEFENLEISLVKSSLESFNKFLSHLGDLLEEETDLDHLYYSLKILISLNRELPKILDPTNFKLVQENIMAKSESIYLKIFELVPLRGSGGISFLDQLESVIISISNDEILESVPSSPSLKLSTLMFHFSNQLLNPNSDHLSDYKNGIIFIDTDFLPLFTTVKTQWFKNLINTKVYESLSNSVGDKKLSKSAISNLFANISFLTCFTQQTPDFDRLKALTEEEINEIDLKEVEKNVLEFYNNCKNTYFPLNA